MKKVMISLAALAMATAANAGTNLVTNGGFESNGGNGQLAYNTNATDWSVVAPNGSYDFIFSPGTADTTGASGEYGTLSLWGPGNGSANGMPATSPNGGYFIASDGDFQNVPPGPISQSITGLTVGKSYVLSFYWAAAQQYGFSGDTSSGWNYSLGSSTGSTGNFAIPSGGFSGWLTGGSTFVATSATETLSFFSTGTGGGGEPPFALLDGVSLVQVPEPATWAMMLVGFGALGTAIRARRKQALAAA